MIESDDRKQQLWSRISTAQHSMQTGVAAKMAVSEKETQPKHLRVGVNMAMVEHSALVELLIEKGVITELEYLEKLAAGIEKEAAAYQEFLSGQLGSNISLH